MSLLSHYKPAPVWNIGSIASVQFCSNKEYTYMLTVDDQLLDFTNNRLLFCLSWLEGLFLTGCRRSLNQRDLYAHPGEADSERLLHTFNW